MNGIPAAIVPNPMIAWDVIFPDRIFTKIAPMTKPMDLHEKKKLNYVYGMWYFVERKGMIGPGATIMHP